VVLVPKKELDVYINCTLYINLLPDQSTLSQYISPLVCTWDK